MWIDLQNLWLKLQHLPLRTHAIIRNVTMLIGAISLFIGSSLSGPDITHPVAWIGIALLIVSYLWMILFYKCPFCGTRLSSFGFPQKSCPLCRSKLH